MKGNNTLTWNKATMIEAVQEYLDKRYTPRIEVTNVQFGATGSRDSFDVCVTDDTRTPSPVSP